MLVYLFVICFVAIMAGPTWFMPLRYWYFNTFKNGRNIKVTAKQVDPKSAIAITAGFKYTVVWSAEGPCQMYNSPNFDSGYAYSDKSVDDAFIRADEKIKAAIKAWNPEPVQKLPSYYYEIDTNGQLTATKEN